MRNFNIKTIIFDLGGVYFSSGTTLAIKRIVDYYNIRDKKVVKDIFGNKPESEGHLLRLGLITMKEFERSIVSKLQLQEKDRDNIRYIWFNSYIPNYRMKEVVKQLRNMDYKLVIFSGNVRERIEFLDSRYNFLRYFDDSLFSYDCQKNKQNIAFYRELLNYIDCNSNESILIDDQTKNTKMAESLGFNVINYCYTDQLIEELKKYNIELVL